MIPLSILDLVPVTEGSDARKAFANTLELARHAERLGYRRYWLAEHHNLPGIASAATAVLIGHIAGGTSTIRVGAGGIMLPNHAPLQVAEQFGTLATLYPGRIDLGLGRAPGTDPAATRALRRYYQAAEEFPADLIELLQYFEPAQPGQAPDDVIGQLRFGGGSPPDDQRELAPRHAEMLPGLGNGAAVDFLVDFGHFTRGGHGAVAETSLAPEVAAPPMLMLAIIWV